MRNFYKALHPLQSTHLAFSPRTFAVEQGQKSTQHCTCHTESDTPRGGEWRVQTAHDGLDESYGPKDLLLLKKPMQAMFHLLLPKVATQRKKEKWWGGGWWFLVVVLGQCWFLGVLLGGASDWKFLMLAAGVVIMLWSFHWDLGHSAISCLSYQ